MKKILRFIASLIIVFFIGFFLAGGKDAMNPAAFTRVIQSALPSHDAPQSKPKDSTENFTAKLRRFVFLPDAVNEKVPAKNFIPVSDLPPRLTEAVVAVEDTRFYTHPGFDINGIFRAALVNMQYGEVTEGASTITQQLVKNLFLSQEQTMSRKIEEVLLALDFEFRYSKNEILSLYLNSIYFGSGYYGIYNASHGYFGKEPSELTLPEAAMLAGLPNAPSLYSPYEDFILAKKRQFIVLDAMVRAGYIDEKTSNGAKIEPLYLAH